MRISTKRGDPGYHSDANLFDILIRLDGVVVRNCVTADEEEGLIVTIGPPNGNANPHLSWEAQEVTTHGTVTIERAGVPMGHQVP